MVSETGKQNRDYLSSNRDAFAHTIGASPQPAQLADRASEEKWIREARTGDLEAFNHLVIAHQDSLYRWSLTLAKDETRAADLTQITLLRAFDVLGAFRGGSFRAWLFHLAYQQRDRVLFMKWRSPSHRPAPSTLDKLPDGLRQALQLVDLEGFDYQDAARVLQISADTLQRRLAQARVQYLEQETSSTRLIR